jgi:polar amino acid transport system substrate-binding protein
VKKLLWLGFITLFAASMILTSCSSGSSPAASASTQITVATDATWPPFESINEQSKNIEGLDIDIFNAIAAKQNINVTYKNVAWDPLLAGMSQGMYDAAISSITITEDRKKDMLFSDPYFAAGQMVTVKIDNNAIKGKDTLSGQVGVQLGTTGDIEVQKIKAATSKPYDDIGLAFQDLMNGQIQAVVCDNPVAMQYVNKNADKIKTVGTTFTDESYGIAVAKGKTDLLAKINAGLKAVKSEGLIEQYSKKWLK